MRALVAVVSALTVVLPLSAGAGLPSFRLTDAQGKTWSQDDVGDARAVVFVFLGTQCPVNNAYVPRLLELSERFGKDGVRLFGVNANEHDNVDAIREHVKRFKITFPVLRDADHALADRLKAERTPEAFVLDSKGTIRYRGRIDDQFGVGYQRPAATQHDLADAVAAVLAGKDVASARTEAPGCYITRAPRPRAGAQLTYGRDVARIVQDRCVECHRPGQIGPMPLLSYEDVANWSAMIKDVIADNRMPPWHADPRYGKFHNDRSLKGKERETLLAWIDQGCAPGDLKQVPPQRTFADGWTIGTPDVVFEMPQSFTVPAKAERGGIPYKYFVVPTNFTEDVWVRAAEAKPGNYAVVHHIIAYVAGPDRKRLGPGSDGIGRGMLVAYAPGDMGSIYSPGSAKKIPKGSSIIFQMHYTPNGTEQSDRSSVGLVFTKAPPQHEVQTRAIPQQWLWIWPGRDDQKFTSTTTFKEDALVWSLMPHMHLRGKSFTFEFEYPDGRRETALSVPRYDFGWQSAYRLERPIEVPAGTKVHCTALFDNSRNNRNNPDPTKLVHWGEQTWEEMMIGFVDYTTVRKK